MTAAQKILDLQDEIARIKNNTMTLEKLLMEESEEHNSLRRTLDLYQKVIRFYLDRLLLMEKQLNREVSYGPGVKRDRGSRRRLGRNVAGKSGRK